MYEGSESGWIDGTDLVFQRKKTTEDYRDELNSNNLEEWFHDKLSKIKNKERVKCKTS